ncbi:MAG: dockerin type I repeat-containing protein, partial [Coriobacteriia bacterium]|nr:dockerin type I repeat-containing protein [Coriobacteriia bacterium]
SLGNLPAGLNLPQNITKAGNNFAYGLFFMAGGPNFQVNLEFVLPALLARNYVGAFCFYSFYLSSLVPVQNRMAASIIGNCPTPSGGNPTFDSHFRDIEYLPVQWGGGGLAYENTGAPRSGDLNGDGMVTIDEVLIATQAAVDNMELTPAQMAALDIDGDGRITMADIVAMTKLLYKIL